jgi:hypothetical protein
LRRVAEERGHAGPRLVQVVVMNKKPAAALPYLPGILLVAFGLLVAAVPELFVAIISAALILAGIAALAMAHGTRKRLQVREWKIVWPSAAGDRRYVFGRVRIRRE